MKPARSIIGGLVIGSSSIFLPACGNSDSGSHAGSSPGAGASVDAASSVSGSYSSVGTEGLTFEFKSGGDVQLTAEGAGSSSGTYVVEGEKLLVTVNGLQHTFIRDGNCLQDQNNVFGELCKGGKAGEASNVSTRNVPTTPTGTYIATNADGEFKLEFKPGNKLTLTATPAGGQPEAQDGSFTIEGDVIYATLAQGVPLVLKFVNDGYESTSFGLPMRFVKQ